MFILSCAFAFALQLLPPFGDPRPSRAIPCIMRFQIEDRCAVVCIEAFHGQGPPSLPEKLHEREPDRVRAMRGSCREDADLRNVRSPPRVNPQQLTAGWDLV